MVDFICPEMTLRPCEVVRPERVNGPSSIDIERDAGAIGFGLLGDGASLLISLHLPSGDAMIARLDVDQFLSFLLDVRCACVEALSPFPMQPN